MTHSTDGQQVIDALGEAIRSRRRVRLRYLDSVREVSPLSLSGDGARAILTAWIETQDRARSFRVAFIRAVTPASGVHFLAGVAPVEGVGWAEQDGQDGASASAGDPAAMARTGSNRDQQ